MITTIKEIKLKEILVVLIICLLSFFPFKVFADTTGQELKVIEQPDRLILELGSAWAGVEFELSLDSGTFPVPVIVDPEGFLKMDLGGSKTYTLICLDSGSNAPIPESTANELLDTLDEDEPRENNDEQEKIQKEKEKVSPEKQGIPPIHLVVFIGGLLLAVGGLIFMYLYKRSQEYYNEDEYDDEYDDDE